jgi:nucleotide-binding universal stress UspA family protein
METTMLKRVLVPIDSAEAAEEILPIVAALTAAGAAARLVHVAPGQDNVITPGGRTVAYACQAMASIEGQWSDVFAATRARLDGGAVDHCVRFGDPVPEILAEAEAFGADTIIVTTTTGSSVKRALLGSVAEAMLRRAGIAVLLYRPPRDS